MNWSLGELRDFMETVAMMSEPIYFCESCKRSVMVVHDGRGFPPSIALRKLRRKCEQAGCECQPTYRAGLRVGGPVVGQDE